MQTSCITENKKVALPSYLKVPNTHSQSFSIDAYDKRSPQRLIIENFIKQGFQKAFNATVSISMPLVLAIKDKKYQAALGIRSANEALFIEQYLPSKVEEVLAARGINVARNELVEIGHLHSNARRFVLPLLLVTAVSLFCSNYKFMVFSATKQVLALLNKTGIGFMYLAESDPKKLVPSTHKWGTYYQTSPQVVAIELASVMELIHFTPQYQELFNALAPQISATARRLGALN